MPRLTELIVALGMMLIAGAVGVASRVAFGLARAEAAVVALAAFTVLVVYHLATVRARDRRGNARQIADLSRAIADLARQIAQQERRLAAIEDRADTAIQKASTMNQPLAAEIAELGVAVRQLSDQAKAGEAATRLPAAREPDGPTKPAIEQAALVDVIRQAIQADGIEIHLQPIVTLPQRKVCSYEALARLRSPSGELLRPPDFLAAAEAAGLVCEIDRLVTFGCVRLVRRLSSNNDGVAIFCNISPATLTCESFKQIVDFMEANRALAPMLVFELPLAAWRATSPREQEALSTLAGFGFRFCLDHVTDLTFDPHDLAERRCAFVKVPAALLLDQRTQAGGAKAAAEFPQALARAGIDLIAEKIETEAVVMDLIDLNVRFGQGMLFSPPRPARPEAMPGTPKPPRRPRRAKVRTDVA